jgi:hypothetical protein
VINPITSHLSQYSDLYIPPLATDAAAGSPTKKPNLRLSPTSAAARGPMDLRSLSSAGDKEGGGGLGKSFLFTTNGVYNMFTEERRIQMREQRDRRVGKEIEKDEERRGGGGGGGGVMSSPPSSPTRPQSMGSVGSPGRTRSSTRGLVQRELVFEKRKVEFDRISDMMIQVRLPLPFPSLSPALPCLIVIFSSSCSLLPDSSVPLFLNPLSPTLPSLLTCSPLPCRLLYCSPLPSLPHPHHALPPPPLPLLCSTSSSI